MLEPAETDGHSVDILYSVVGAPAGDLVPNTSAPTHSAGPAITPKDPGPSPSDRPVTAPRLRALVPLLALLAGCTTHGSVSVLPRSVEHLYQRVPSAEERTVLADKGLVISTTATAPSFHLGYTALFKAHEPVYFTADSLLYALHASYDAILLDVEIYALAPELAVLLSELRVGVASSTAGDPAVRADLDVYLSVAQSLLSGRLAETATGVGNEAVAKLVAAAQAQTPASVALFGEQIDVDLSLMKVRGHYTRSEPLGRYFRAMTWLGHVGLRVAGVSGGAVRVNRRALEGALVLHGAMSARAALANRRLDEAIGVFVGPPNALSLSGFAHAASHYKSLAVAPNAEVVRVLDAEEAPRIAGQLLSAGDRAIDVFLLGARYVLDSHVFSAVTYGRLAAKRMMPSPLDVGWGVFRNPAALDLLKPEIERFHYRDALDAVAARAEEAGPALWEGSIYHLWLGALKALSPDAQRDAPLPRLMRSDAWARRMLNTQLASWAELRHDTVLYTQHSFSAPAACAYPDAYVEPYPAFFAALSTLAERGAALVGRLDFGENGSKKGGIVAYFHKLRAAAGTLGEIAEVERRGQPIDAQHLDFINHAVSWDAWGGGCSMTVEPRGWFAELHYDKKDISEHVPTIADVHTQPTDGDGNSVGNVLHVATDVPRAFTVTLDTCTGPRTYQGFVSSYREVTTGGFHRLDDAEWLRQRAATPDVAWMKDLLAR